MSSYESMVKAMSAVGVYTFDSDSGVGRELQAYAAELDALSGVIDEIICESIAATAENEGLNFYEKLVGTLGDGLELGERREMILSLLRLNTNDNTPGGIKKFFKSIGLECEIEESPHIFDLYIKPLGGSYSMSERQYMISRAREFLPCHLTFTIDFRTMTWADYDSSDRTFARIDAMELTWEEFEGRDFYTQS